VQNVAQILLPALLGTGGQIHPGDGVSFFEPSSSQTLIEHWNGTRWSLVPSSDPNGNALLSGVVTVSASDIRAVSVPGRVTCSTEEQLFRPAMCGLWEDNVVQHSPCTGMEAGGVLS